MNLPNQSDLPETFTQMINLSCLLKVSAKITKAGGSNLDNDAIVAPVNLLLHSMFKDVALKANGTIISQVTSSYPYRASKICIKCCS